MKILRIRFKNLNSLAGEWVIDLTHPAFTADGIFAITGPTGAGKSTILDAICLALYGRTPRLEKITRGGNEIMSRRTGECFAEVLFETQKGTFLCHWGQHRARGRSDGELQIARHEVSEAGEGAGRIIENKRRAVGSEIERLTGMDFQRFTRSMMLAQGGFAAFLRAGADERAPILESITGTEIYSRISMAVHERRAGEREKLDALLAELQGMQPLEEEAKRALGLEREEKRRQERELDGEITRKDRIIAWLEGMARLEEALGALEGEQHQLSLREAAFEPDRERLARGLLALELAGEHAGLHALRDARAVDEKALDTCRRQMPAQEEKTQAASLALDHAEGALAARRIEREDARPGIRETQALDLQLREKAPPIAAAEADVAGRQKILDGLRAEDQQDRRRLQADETTLQRLLKQIEQTSIHAGLVEQLTGIEARFDGLLEIDSARRAKETEYQGATERQRAATERWDEGQKKLQAATQRRDAAREELERKRRALKDTLEGREPEDWRADLSAYKEKQNLLEKLAGSLLALTQSREALAGIETRLKALLEEETALAVGLREQKEQQAAREREARLLETQLDLLRRIRNLDEARGQLRDGEPCPLCGAEEHPFAQGNIPVPHETQARLEKIKTGIEAGHEALSRLEIQQAGIQKEREQIHIRKTEHQTRAADGETGLREALARLSMEDPGEKLPSTLPGLQKKNHQDLEKAQGIVRFAEKTRKDLDRPQKALEENEKTLLQLEREVRDSLHEKDTVGIEHQRIQKETQALDIRHRKAYGDTLTALSPYGIQELTPDTLEEIRDALIRHRAQWIARQNEKNEIQKQMASLEITIRHRAEGIEAAAMERKNREKELGELRSVRDALARERQALFGAKDPGEEEVRLDGAVAAAEKHREDARRTLDAAVREQAGLTDKASALEAALATRGPRIREAETAFRLRLGGAGFQDEADYQRAELPEKERADLRDREQMLATEKTELGAKQREKKTLLAAERGKQLLETVEPGSREAVEKARDEQVERRRALQQEIGAIAQKLRDNDEREQRQRVRLENIAAQKRECARWDTLHGLIGSADGKKYRNFAQGLTFEKMIGHANRQLRKMTGRYLLVRGGEGPLELQVMDTYQAGEIRSTRNLSGGESFIVSLSLALALSHMARRNVRIDSLFLDEGFATLDEEALETALETLAGLRRDGKVIGVISHIPALKERIGTQIQVIPRTGGKSRLDGPGCEAGP